MLFNACGGKERSGQEKGVRLTGQFLDSKVAGLNYRTPSFEGLTDQNGSFYYYDGERIEFSVGKIVLGEAKAEKTMTPIEVCAASNATDKKVLNVLKLLQSVDDDSDSTNGIVISDEIRNLAQEVDVNLAKDQDVNIGELLQTHLLRDSTEIVSDEEALSRFINTLESSPDASGYCEVASDRFGSIFTTHTDDCQQKKYREAYYDLLLPMFRIAGELSKAEILSTIDEAELRRDTIEQILNAKKATEYVQLIRSTSATGVTKEAIDLLIGDAADQVGGVMAKSVGSLAGNERYGDIWYRVLKSYADAPAAIIGDPDAIRALVTSQVNSLWQTGSDLLGAWDLNNLTEQNNELSITQHVLEYYYSNLTDTERLMQVLELTGDFNWNSVVEKVAALKGYENGILSEEYTTSKIVSQVTAYIRLIETTVDFEKSLKLTGKLLIKNLDGTNEPSMPEGMIVRFAPCTVIDSSTTYHGFGEYDYPGAVSNDGTFSIDLNNFNLDLDAMENCTPGYKYGFQFYIDRDRDRTYGSEDLLVGSGFTDSVENIIITVTHVRSSSSVDVTDYAMSGNEYVTFAPIGTSSASWKTTVLIDSRLESDYYVDEPFNDLNIYITDYMQSVYTGIQSGEFIAVADSDDDLNVLKQSTTTLKRILPTRLVKSMYVDGSDIVMTHDSGELTINLSNEVVHTNGVLELFISDDMSDFDINNTNLIYSKAWRHIHGSSNFNCSENTDVNNVTTLKCDIQESGPGYRALFFDNSSGRWTVSNIFDIN